MEAVGRSGRTAFMIEAMLWGAAFAVALVIGALNAGSF